MGSLFPHRRRQHRPVPPVHEPDPWGIGSATTSEDAAASSSSSRTTAVKIMHSMRRFSYSSPKRRDRGQPEGGMYSTPAESCPPTPSPYSFHDRPDTRPTIEQIAMGLHISRTPHALHRSAQPFHPPSRRSGESPRSASHSHLLTRPNAHTRRASMSAVVLPPPPSRSALKKPGIPATAEGSLLATSASDASISTMTTLTSNGPSTPRSVQSAPATSFPGKLRMEMLRLLPTRKGSLTASTRSDSPSVLSPSSDDDSATGVLTPRKMVRFTTESELHDVPPGPP